MDWEKVKKLIIFFLCLLNISLTGLIYYNNRAYRLTLNHERNIMSVLQQNNIIFYSELIRNFSPMRQIEMQLPEYDHELLLSLFMNDLNSVRQSMERNRIIYRNETETLIIDDSEIIYRNRNGGGVTDISHEEAERTAKDFVQKIRRLGGSFVADTAVPIETEEGLLFQYREMYRGFIINSNYINITINSKGITRVEFSYFKPVAFVGVRRDICSADEALLTVMYGIRNIFGEYTEPKFITRMDIVYHNNLSTRASPYYRIFISGFLEPFLINAYENTLL